MKDKSRALVVTQEDEGFDWNKYIPNDGVALVAEIVEKQEKVNMEEVIAGWRKARLQVEATYAPRYDEESGCYLDADMNLIHTDLNSSFVGLFETREDIAKWKKINRRRSTLMR
ncbi:hypothetical protein Hanom_Chr06g00533101 [Helianthus anomalus]